MQEGEANKNCDADADNPQTEEHGQSETGALLRLERVSRFEKRFLPRYGQAGVLVTLEEFQKPGVYYLVAHGFRPILI